MSKRGKSKSIRFGTVTNKAAGFTKGVSSRNTLWNGVDYSGGKWQGHVVSASDTVTSAGLGTFDIQGRGFQEVADLLDQASGYFSQMAQDAIAKGAAEGRKEATKIEENEFHFGNVWIHASGIGAHAPGGRWKSSSRLDPRLGGYRGVGSSGNALRLINFNFKAGHTYGDLGGLPGTIEARVTSQMANLFENNARWKKNSPVWSQDGSNWGRYWKGSTRQGKHYFNRFYHAFDEGLLAGIPLAEKTFNQRLSKAYVKNARAFTKILKTAP